MCFLYATHVLISNNQGLATKPSSQSLTASSKYLYYQHIVNLTMHNCFLSSQYHFTVFALCFIYFYYFSHFDYIYIDNVINYLATFFFTDKAPQQMYSRLFKMTVTYLWVSKGKEEHIKCEYHKTTQQHNNFLNYHHNMMNCLHNIMLTTKDSNDTTFNINCNFITYAEHVNIQNQSMLEKSQPCKYFPLEHYVVLMFPANMF